MRLRLLFISHLKEATNGHVRVTVTLCTDVRRRQAVAFPVHLFAKA